MTNPASADKIAKFQKIWSEEVEKKRILDAKYADADIKENVDNYIRILPNRDPNKHFFLKSAFHKVSGDYYNCPKEFKNAKCPICEHVSRLYKNNTLEDLAVAKDLKKVKRYYYNVIVRSAEDKGVRVLTSGVKLFEKIIGACANPEIGDISDIKEGYDFIIRKRMKDGFWNYDLSEASRKQSPLSQDAKKIEEWLNSLFDLEKEVTLLSYQELKDILDGALGTITQSVQPPPMPTPTKPFVPPRVPEGGFSGPRVAEQQQPAPDPTPATPPIAPAPVMEDEETVDAEIAEFKKNLERLKQA